MPPIIYLTFSLIISRLHLTIAMHDGQYSGETVKNNQYFSMSDGQFIRSLRNIYQPGINPQQSEVRFGWQNPIRVAPTLRPTQNYSPSQNYPSRPPQQSYPLRPPQRYPSPPSYTTTPRYIYPPTTPPNTFPFRPPYQYSTTEFYRDPLFTSGSNRNNQFIRPGESRPNAQPQTSGNCQNGSKRDKQSKECIQLGSSCGENMVFYEDPSNRDFGECDCIQNVNRPLVYHAETRKCYFVFQQAYFPESNWLIVESLPNGRPNCSRNVCRQWARSQQPDWIWTNNDPQLDKIGTVALLNERTCSMLGSSCKQEGNEKLAAIISQNPQDTEISLQFEGSQLVCRKISEISEFDLNGKYKNNMELICKPGLFNKWRLAGRCKDL